MDARESERYISCAVDHGFEEAAARQLLAEVGGAAALSSLESFLQLLLAAECPEDAFGRSLRWETYREYPSGRPFYGERPLRGAAQAGDGSSSSPPTQWAKPRALCLQQWKTVAGHLNVDVNLVREVCVLFDAADRTVEAAWGGWTTLARLAQNVIANPDQAKFRRLKSAGVEGWTAGSQRVQELLSRNDARVLVKGIGFTIIGAEASSETAANEQPPARADPADGGDDAIISTGRDRMYSKCRILMELITERDQGIQKMHQEHKSASQNYGAEDDFCSHCKRKIESGRRRLFTGDWEAPPGEFKYCCGLCQGFQLCTDCFDRHEQGSVLHPPSHSLVAVPPQTQRHNRHSFDSTTWAGGGARGGGAAARARERLRERTGM